MVYDGNLDRAWDKITKMEPFKTDEVRPPRFRLSSSPFCPYRFLFDWYDYIKSGEVDYWDYPSDFYTDIGTTIHSLLQKWIPINNPGSYLGNWECPRCHKRIEAAVGPKFCKDCGKWMIYDEFSFLEEPGFSGHCDGILLLNKNLVKSFGLNIHKTRAMDKYIRQCKNPVEAVVLEFKSAGSYKAKRITGPTPRNKAQALMYVPCAQHKMDELGLNVNIIGAVVKYLSRDIPTSASNDFFLPVNNEKLFKYNQDIVKAVYKAVRKGKVKYIKEIEPPCQGKYKHLYDECAYFESCKKLRKETDMFLEDTRKRIKKDFDFLDSLDKR